MASTVIDRPLDTLRGDNLEIVSVLWIDTPIDYIQKRRHSTATSHID